MATTKRRFYNPHNVLHGIVEVNTVQSITLNKTWQRLTGRGDNDLSPTFQARTGLDVNGNVVIQDPMQADALLEAPSGIFQWDGMPEPGGLKKRHSVTGVEFFSLAETDAHGALDTITLGWNSFDPTGADPHTVTTVGP